MQFFSIDSSPLDAPLEWVPAVLDLDVDPDRWESVRFSINEVLVPVYVARRFGQSRTLVDWPRTGPGFYRLSAEAPGNTDTRTITIAPSKLGTDGLAALVDDLERRLPTSIALGLQRAGGLVGIRLRPPADNTLEQEVVRLRRAIEGSSDDPGLRWLLPAIAADPHSMLTREDRWVRREGARRIPAAALVQTLTRPANMDGSNRPVHVLDSRVETTFDVYENRMLKAFIREVFGRLRRLEVLTDPDSSLGSEIRDLRGLLRDAERRAPFLNAVVLGPQPADRLTMVLLREPRYRALLNRFQEFHRSLWVEMDDERLDAPLQDVPSLYQSWGTLHVIDVLLALGAELGFRVAHHRIVYRRPGALFVRILRDGSPALRLEHPESGIAVSLTPERTYGRTGPHRSVSFAQRPDIAIEIRSPLGRSDVLLFDPKYKLDADDEGRGAPVKSDIDKMHSYRDAIRDSEGRHLVRYAATLYPGRTQHYGREVAAVSAVPASSSEMRKTVRDTLLRYLKTPTGD